MSRFTYLHLHTQFSRDGGPASPAQWCRAAVELGYTTLAVADRGPLVAFPTFNKAARQSGMQPVYGMEADILLHAPQSTKAGGIRLQPAVFFARDKQGLENLARLASIAYLRWPQEEHALKWESVMEHSAGLALVLLVADDGASGGLTEWGASVKECFGDAAYVGLAHPGASDDHTQVEKIVAAAGQMSLPTVAMPTARYIRPEDKLSYQAMQAARRRAGWTKGSDTEAKDESAQYLLAPDEAAELYVQWPEVLENVARLAEMCAGVGYLDDLASETFRGTQQAERLRLQGIAEKRLLRKLETDSLPEAVKQWLDDELAAYERQNALPAWSTLASVCTMAQSHNGQPAIPLGAPLGTADGSLLAYALGISPVNPVDYPRPAWLLTGEHATDKRLLPLPGVELPANRRDEMLASLARDYGTDRAALAACQIDIDPLTALSAASEVLGTSGDIHPLALQAMSQGWSAFTADKVNSTESAPAGLALSLKGAPLTFKPDPDMLLVASMDAKLPGWLPMLARGEGQPTAWVPISEEAAAELRLPAVMLRLSSALTALASTVSYIAQYPVPGLAVEELDLTDFPVLSDKAASMLAKGELVGIPYLSAAALKGWKGEITPATAATLVARSIATRKSPTAPKLDQWTEKTADTGGFLIYRDQFEVLVTSSASFPVCEAHQLRALLLKGSDDEHEPTMRMKERFFASCAENGLDEETTETLWQALAESAPDLQSRCSIAARARTAMWTAFFKAEHPAAFIAAQLSANIDRKLVPVPTLASEARRMGVGIKPPDASHSMPAPTLERGGAEWTILWGLALLPRWTREAASKFVKARPRGGFGKMADFALAAVDAGLTLAQLETLVRAGACDSLGGQVRSREALLEALPAWLEWARSERSQAEGVATAGPADLFSLSDAQSTPPPDEKATLKNAPLTPRERYLRRTWEVEQLGVGFTPAGEIEALKRTLESSHLRARLLQSVQIGEEHIGKSVALVGLLTCIRLVNPSASNNGTTSGPMSVAWVEDCDGGIEFVAFPPGYKRHAELWTENNLVIITGRVRKHEDGDIYLLCEHMAAFEGAAEEAEISVKVKQSKKAQSALEEIASTQVAPVANGKTTGTGNGTHPAANPVSTTSTTVPPTPAKAPAATPIAAGATTPPTAASNVPIMTNTATTTTGGPPAHKIIITLPITEDDQADIDRMIALKDILFEHPGSDVVTLHIPYSPEPGHVTTAQLPRGVSYSTVLEADIVRLLGTKAVAVIRF